MPSGENAPARANPGAAARRHTTIDRLASSPPLDPPTSASTTRETEDMATSVKANPSGRHEATLRLASGHYICQMA